MARTRIHVFDLVVDLLLCHCSVPPPQPHVGDPGIRALSLAATGSIWSMTYPPIRQGATSIADLESILDEDSGVAGLSNQLIADVSEQRHIAKMNAIETTDAETVAERPFADVETLTHGEVSGNNQELASRKPSQPFGKLVFAILASDNVWAIMCFCFGFAAVQQARNAVAGLIPNLWHAWRIAANLQFGQCLVS